MGGISAQQGFLRQRQKLVGALRQKIRKHRTLSGQGVHGRHRQQEHKGVGGGAVRGRHGPCCHGCAERKQVAGLVGKGATHLFGQSACPGDSATAYVNELFDFALGRFDHRLVGREVLLAGLRQEVIQIGGGHLGKRRMPCQFLAKVLKQAAGGPDC